MKKMLLYDDHFKHYPTESKQRSAVASSPRSMQQEQDEVAAVLDVMKLLRDNPHLGFQSVFQQLHRIARKYIFYENRTLRELEPLLREVVEEDCGRADE